MPSRPPSKIPPGGTTFEDDERIGREGVAAVQRIVGWKTAVEASVWDEKRGIDAWVDHDGQLVSAQVKNDVKSADTGNAFIEHRLHYRDRRGTQLGWLWTCESEWLFLRFPGKGILLTRPRMLRHAMATILNATELGYDEYAYSQLKPGRTTYDKKTGKPILHASGWAIDIEVLRKACEVRWYAETTSQEGPAADAAVA